MGFILNLLRRLATKHEEHVVWFLVDACKVHEELAVHLVIAIGFDIIAVEFGE